MSALFRVCVARHPLPKWLSAHDPSSATVLERAAGTWTAREAAEHAARYYAQTGRTSFVESAPAAPAAQEAAADMVPGQLDLLDTLERGGAS